MRDLRGGLSLLQKAVATVPIGAISFARLDRRLDHAGITLLLGQLAPVQQNDAGSVGPGLVALPSMASTLHAKPRHGVSEPYSLCHQAVRHTCMPGAQTSSSNRGYKGSRLLPGCSSSHAPPKQETSPANSKLRLSSKFPSS